MNQNQRGMAYETLRDLTGFLGVEATSDVTGFRLWVRYINNLPVLSVA